MKDIFCFNCFFPYSLIIEVLLLKTKKQNPENIEEDFHGRQPQLMMTVIARHSWKYKILVDHKQSLKMITSEENLSEIFK